MKMKKTYFYMNGFALSLGLKRRLTATRKWVIDLHVAVAVGRSFLSHHPPSFLTREYATR